MEFEWDVDTDSAARMQKQVQGMTLRDWFAGQASESDIEAHTQYLYCDAFPGDTAMMRDCTREQAKYRYADAMMEARKK